jgi:hypothetical protein
VNVNSQSEKACAAADLKHRAQFQNKLAGICEDMCKEVEAYPKCTCPNFVEPDSTPGVMTWDELLDYMDGLAQWGRDSIKGWHTQASQLQVTAADMKKLAADACAAEDLMHRTQLQNGMAGICEDMCKEVEAYPKCTCPNFVEPDSTPGVMTWDELLEYMDGLAQWGRDSIKGWHKQASQIQIAHLNTTTDHKKNATAFLQTRSSCQLEGQDWVADITVSPTSVAGSGAWKFKGAGVVHIAHKKACPPSANTPLPEPDEKLVNGGASQAQLLECADVCCISYCCGDESCFSKQGDSEALLQRSSE